MAGGYADAPALEYDTERTFRPWPRRRWNACSAPLCKTEEDVTVREVEGNHWPLGEGKEEL
jgi:hypothetical protein